MATHTPIPYWLSLPLEELVAWNVAIARGGEP